MLLLEIIFTPHARLLQLLLLQVALWSFIAGNLRLSVAFTGERASMTCSPSLDFPDPRMLIFFICNHTGVYIILGFEVCFDAL